MSFVASLTQPIPASVHSLACFIKSQLQTHYLVIMGGYDISGEFTNQIYKLNLQDIPFGWTYVGYTTKIAGIGSSQSVFQLPITSARMDTYIFSTYFSGSTKESAVIANDDKMIDATEDGKYGQRLNMRYKQARVRKTTSPYAENLYYCILVACLSSHYSLVQSWSLLCKLAQRLEKNALPK